MMLGRLRRLGPVLRAALGAPVCQVGGQAVIEGVMMRGVRHWAVAVRQPDNEIVVVDEAIAPWAAGHAWLRLPIIRGVIALGESLVIGMKALSISAAKAAGEDEEGDDAISKSAIGLTLVFSLAVAVGLFFILPIFLTKTVLNINGGGFSFWAVEGVVRLVIFLLYLWLISFMPDLRRVFQFHAAEHMAIHAYEAGDPIEAEYAKKYPQLHVRCGTAFLLIVMVLSIFVFAAVRTGAWHWLILSRIVGIPIIAGLSYEVIRWAGRNKDKGYVQTIMKPGLWLQHLTTRKPEMEHLEVACVALNRVLELEADPPAWAADVEVMA
jgi:uncharacterized protein YqhQ